MPDFYISNQPGIFGAKKCEIVTNEFPKWKTCVRMGFRMEQSHEKWERVTDE